MPARSRSQLLVIWGISALCVLMVLALLTATFGGVFGEEFAPETMTRRSFSYYELPLLRLQVVPIRRRASTNPLEKQLAADGYVPKNKQDARWDLVRWVDSREIEMLGDAIVLTRYLDARNGNGDLRWLAWTQKHPELAKVLWPHVIRLAEKQMYLLVPIAFRAAETVAAEGDAASEQPGDRLNQLIRQRLAQGFVRLADSQRELAEHEIAVELYGEAIQLDGGTAAAFTGRARSLRELGRTDEAEIDEATARELQSMPVPVDPEPDEASGPSAPAE